MIKTQEEYNNACDFIDSDMELYDFQLSEKMSSYEYNLYLQDTEYFLNFLYEKIRTLEELCDYLDEYIDTKINRTKKDIVKKIAFIQESMEQTRYGKTSDLAPVWNLGESQHIADRDGAWMPAAVVADKRIMSFSRKTNFIVPTLLSKEKTNEAYQDNLSTALRDGVYTVAYQHSRYIPVSEKIHVSLPENENYNCIDIEPVHCSLSIEKDDTGFIVTMYPDDYDKELRNFNFKPYTGSALNKVALPVDKYDVTKTVIDNRNKFLQIESDKNNQKQMQEIILAQQIQNLNKQKDSITGEM